MGAWGTQLIRHNLGKIPEAGACPVSTQRDVQDASHYQVASTRKPGAHIAAVVARRLVLDFMEGEEIEAVARRAASACVASTRRATQVTGRGKRLASRGDAYRPSSRSP